MPELLYRLVATSVRNPTELRIPYGDGSGQPSWDGVVTLYRNRILTALAEYFADYRKRLLSKKRSQTAFPTKFDHLAKA